MSHSRSSSRAVASKIGSLKCLFPLIVFSASPNVFAQQADVATAQATNAGAESTDSIEEVVVTAQRRKENVQTIPITVSAITADMAERLGITDTTALTAAIPGLDFSRQGNAATPFIRGVGATSSLIGDEAPVATYVDGVYISSPQATLFSLNNIDHIEVLKGPQGTLFGRNATGGVVQIITKDPTQATQVDIQGSYGNYRTTTSSFYASTGIADNLAADISIYDSNQTKGWGKDLATAQDAFRSRDVSTRTKWVWTPLNNTKATFSFDFGRSDGEQGVGQSPLPGTLGLDGVTTNGGFYNVYNDPNDYYRTTQFGESLKIEHDFGWARLMSLTSNRRYKSPFGLDQDVTPSPIINANIQGRDRGTSQELQLLSPTDSRIQWIGGLYTINDVSGYQPLGLSGYALQGLVPLETSYVAPFEEIYSAQRLQSYSAFTQATATVYDATHLTLGFRYTSDHRGIKGYTVLPSTIPAYLVPLVAPTADQSASFKKPTWRIALDHQFTPDLMSYVSYNRGFKSGVFNGLAYSDPAVSPEVLDAYETGLKSEFLNHRVRFNAATFYYDYKNIQVDQETAGVSSLLNAAKAKIYGADLDLTVIPINHLTITNAMEFLHGRYASFPNAPLYTPAPTGGDTTSSFDATGKHTVHSPSFTGNLSATYTYPIQVGSLDFSVSEYYDSGFYWNPDNRIKQPSYNIVNASVMWTAPKGNWDARFWGKNLLDKKYYSYETDEATGDEGSPAAPLTYGITVGYHFD